LPVSLGFINIRCMLNKFDDVIDLLRTRDVICIAESWHDSDSVVLGRLRSAGYFVADRPRPRMYDDGSINHGGVVVVSRYPLAVTAVEQSPTFELLCVRVVIGSESVVLAVIYRPSSLDVNQRFFDDFGGLLERLATLQARTFVVGDFNVHLEITDDAAAKHFRELIECYGFDSAPFTATHCLGGTIDAVLHRVNSPVSVRVVDVGLSDHYLLDWSIDVARPTVATAVVTSRPWSRLDAGAFRTALSSSAICRPDSWPSHLDSMALMYDDVISGILDDLLPARSFPRIRRPTDPWFDNDCRASKRLTRRLERYYAAVRRRGADGVEAAQARDAWYQQRRVYRSLRHRKSGEFWKSTIDAERGDPSKLWRSIDCILGRSRDSNVCGISADCFADFFRDKVSNIRRATEGAPSPEFRPIDVLGVQFDAFDPVSSGDVITAIGRLPNKFSAADPLPTSLLKQVADLVAPFIVELVNRSFHEGYVPQSFKSAFLTPIVKKAGLDPTDTSSYRPISNLSVLSKLLERLVAQQLWHYLRQFDLLPPLQSGFRPGHSTETAVLRVLSDLLTAVDRGDVGVLVLLDLSAAFDTVDHRILLERLRTSFGVTGQVSNWFRSYLTGRRQHVRCGLERSSEMVLDCGVPQGSVLGPVLFILYTADLCGIIESHGFQPHLYADDTQIYGSCRPSDADSLSSRISTCVDDVFCWLRSNRLQPNPDKTEVLWCSSLRRLYTLPTAALTFGGASIVPVRSVRNLGIFLDAALTMREHVTRTVSRCFGALRQLRSVRRHVSAPVFRSLVTTLVLTRLDYGNATMVGLPAEQLRRLQAVENAAARLIFGLRRTDRVTPALLDLHWLRIPERIEFKVLSLTYRALHGSAPRYLDVFRRVADQPGRRGLRSAATDRLVVPSSRLVSAGDRSFPTAGAVSWNRLPPHVTSSPTYPTFLSRLKTFLFSKSFSGSS
jgi:Reverse transcriptase (RNA-dependent DNA polymerase)/Endonuclease/Exonuclease/phosphatase family